MIYDGDGDDISVVFEYFRLLNKKDIDGLLNLFTNDSVIFEPFSKLSSSGEGLRDRVAMKAFFQISAMANEGLQHIIISHESKQVNEEHFMGCYTSNGKAKDSSTITALVRFEKEQFATARFVFEAVKYPVSNILTHNEEGGKNAFRTWKIKSLHIEFLN